MIYLSFIHFCIIKTKHAILTIYVLSSIFTLLRQTYDPHYHRVEIDQNSDSLLTPLKLMYSRMSPRAYHHHHQYTILTSSPGSFDRRLFRIIVQNVSKTSAFVTGKCRFKVKSAGKNLAQNGVFVAYFRTYALKKWGQNFTRVGVLFDLHSVTLLYDQTPTYTYEASKLYSLLITGQALVRT